jgi:phage terminase large subunit-like protein
MPSLTANEPMVLALDAAKGGAGSLDPDSFAVVGVTRSPHDREQVAVRYVGIWEPPRGGLLDYEPIEAEIRRLCAEFAVVVVVYDPYQLHDLSTRLKKEGVAHFQEFVQGKPRLLSDRGLLDLILSKRIIHDGNVQLRAHIDNANIKKSGEGMRIVKRATSLKVDAAVALSMASAECMRLTL